MGKELTLQHKTAANSSTFGAIPIGAISLLFRFTLNLVTAIKHIKRHLKFVICSESTPQKIIVLLANNKCEIVKASPFFPSSLNPDIIPPITVLSIILLSTSVVKVIRRDDNGSPCLSPFEPEKKLEGLPLTSTEKLTEDMHILIHLLHLSPKPYLSNKYRRLSQLTWSLVSMLTLKISPGKLLQTLLSRHSFAIRTKSKICLPLANAFCESDTSLPTTLLNLFAKTFAKIL